MTHEGRLFLMALGAGSPGSLVALLILWSGDYTAKVQWTLTVFIVVFWWGFALAVRERTVLPLQTVANLLEALREGDYSIRARDQAARDTGAGSAAPRDSLGEVMVEVNHLGDILRRQRFSAVDAGQLLQKVIEEIDLAVFTFDEEACLRLVNPAGERMMAQPAGRLLGRSAAELGLADCLVGESVRTFERSFPGQSGRFQCRRGRFREAGRPLRLLVLSDVSKALREEERQAWQRLIRVLGHELNNSLAPIKSTASTLESLLHRDVLPEGWRTGARRGLEIIVQRCASLHRFVASYSRLARLPPPRLRPLPVAALIRRVVALETRLPVALLPGPAIILEADRDQLEQLLINLVKNAVEAALEKHEDEPGAAVSIGWQLEEEKLEVVVRDNGAGIANAKNIFVPFFTTKPGGTGIGLVLCRQIAEAHEGTLELENVAGESGAEGCEAKLRLPLVSRLKAHGSRT